MKSLITTRRFVLIAFILAVMTVGSLMANQELFKVTSTGNTYTEVEFNLSDYVVVPVEVDGVKYNRLYHPEAGFLMDDELPEVLHFSFLLEVPRTGTVKIDDPTINEYQILKNFPLFPSQGADLEICDEKGFVIDRDFYEKDINYPEYIVQLSSPQTMRDSRLVNVTLYPFAYNPARNELTVRERMTIRVNYDLTQQGELELREPERRKSRAFENIKRHAFLNYDQFRNPNIEFQPRSVMIIRHHSNTIDVLVNQFATWKRDKGFEVTVATTANMSTNIAIKNYILNAYHNWQVPPEYVVIIGDGGGGSLTVPYDPGQNDHYYSLLETGSVISSVFVGRISVPNADGLATIWNKIRNYERTPYMAETAWYNHSTLIGDLTSHGATISPKFLMKYLKEMMLHHSPEKELTEIYEQPFLTRMTDGMNRGGLFFWYRGAIGCSGWPPAETAMTNGLKLPHAHFVTCSTLDYLGGRQAEPTFRAGTPTTARGAVTVIGFRGGARTGPGNALTGGTINGIYVGGIRTMGEALVYSKINLWRVYGNNHSQHFTSHSYSGNLLGDPSMDIWLNTPEALNVTYPETLPAGSNSIVITVRDAQNNPVKDAWVTVRKVAANGEETIFTTGYTGADGISTRFFPPTTTGDVKVTVTKPEYIPHLGSTDITGAPAVSFHDVVFNGDYNAGSQVDFVVVAKNHRNEAVNGVNGVLSSPDPYVTIVNNSSAFGNLAAGATGASNAQYRVNIHPDAPANRKIVFNLTMSDNAQNSWVSRFMINVRNANLIVANLNVLDDGGNGVLDPLEEADLRFHIRNTGQFAISNVRGRLTGDAFGLSIIDSSAVFGNIAPGQTVASTDNHFRLSTSTYVIPGQRFTFNLLLYNNEGFRQNQRIDLQIGTVTVRTPFGPDEHGYWIFDNGDEGYVDSPEYDWIEIAPGQGGFNGTNLNIVADFDNIQGFRTIDLPFSFKFYGMDYDDVTVCANGWISFGVTESGEQRPWRLPGVLGPSPMVAAFWENLSTAQGGIFSYYDQERGLFIIQWQNMLNVMNSAPNTFQVILYDPAVYYTTTFDGPIKVQYKVFNNVNNGPNAPPGIGNWGTYATIGIRNHYNSIGLEYTFNNQYPTAAMRLGNETAIYITTGLSSALVGIESYSFSDGNNNIPEYGETLDVNMTLQNVGIEPAGEVIGVLSSEDQYITIIQDRAEFGDIDIQGSVQVNNAYTVQIADNVPHNHRAYFTLTVTAADNLYWSYDFSFRVSAPSLTSLSPFIHDPAPGGNNNGMIDPGEELIMYLPIKNVGATTPPVNISVVSEGNLATVVSIDEPMLYFITSEETQYPAIHLRISENAQMGSGLRFSYTFETGHYTFEGQFLVGVGGIIPVRMGTGDTVPGNNMAGPINIYYRSNRSQFIYTRDEFNAEGIYGEFPINQFGFYIQGAPVNQLPDFKIRMGHTTEQNVSTHRADSLTMVYRVNNHNPVAGDWHLLTLDRPFLWNGVDNLLIDTSFAPVSGWSSTGQIRVYDYENGYRYTRADSPDQTDQVTTTVSNDKPQAMLMMGIDPLATANRPRNLTAQSTTTSIDLAWQPPQNRYDDANRRRGFTGRDAQMERNTTYNVYRNGVKLNAQPVTLTQFQDDNIEGYTTYHYYVTSVIDGNESNPSNVVSIEADAVAIPLISPEGGVYYEPVSVTITTETENSVIYYTLDGSDPTVDDYLYQEPFEIDYYTVVKAKGFRDGWLDSRVAAAEYHILYAPTNVSGVGTRNSIELTWAEPWSPEERTASVNDRTSRSNQINRSSLNHRGALGYNVYKAEEEDDEFVQMNETLIEGFEYRETGLELGVYYYYVTALYPQGESASSGIIPVGVGVVTKPFFSHSQGSYDNYIDLVLSSHTSRTVIHYTLNGDDPDETSPHYTGPIRIDETTTVKAYAIRTDWYDSEMVTSVYTIIYSSVEEEDILPEVETELMAAYPNPFNPSTTIAFSLRESDKVTVEVYNIIGKKVKTLVNDYLPSGNHQVVWEGDDASGRKVGSGIYFYRMKTSDYTAVRKIVMVK